MIHRLLLRKAVDGNGKAGVVPDALAELRRHDRADPRGARAAPRARSPPPSPAGGIAGSGRRYCRSRSAAGSGYRSAAQVRGRGSGRVVASTSRASGSPASAASPTAFAVTDSRQRAIPGRRKRAGPTASCFAASARASRAIPPPLQNPSNEPALPYPSGPSSARRT